MEQYIRHNIIWYDLGCQSNTVSIFNINTLFANFFKEFFCGALTQNYMNTEIKVHDNAKVF